MSRNPNQMNLVKIFKAGQRYIDICPKDRALYYSFPELKVINYIKMTKKILPPIIIGLILWQYSLPAQLAVTLNLVDSYNRIKSQLIEKKVLSPNRNPNEKLTFESLMKLLNLSKIHLDNYFGQDDNN